MLTMSDYLIGVGLGGIGVLCLFHANTIYNRIRFYYRISYVVIAYSIQHLLFYSTTSDTSDDKSSFFVDMLIEMAKTDVIFVKVLQAISFNGNFIDKDVHDRITQFSDNVPYDTLDIDYNVSMRMMTDTPFTFTNKPGLPIRSGMISLVYALQNKKTGEKYIMKVKRKNIDERVNESIDNMMGLLYFLSMGFRLWSSLDVLDVVSRHLGLLREQLDFVQEEANTEDAYNDLDGLEYIRIPKIYKCEGLSGRAIIMEYLPGTHLNDVLDIDKPHYRDLTIKYFFASSLIFHKFHGDLHSGNMLCIDNGPRTEMEVAMGNPRYQLGIIDFGIVMHFPKNITSTLFYIFEHQQNPKMNASISRAYLENFIHPPNMMELLSDDRADAILNATGDVARSVFQEGVLLDQAHFYKIFKGISDNLSHEFVVKHNVRTNDGLVKLEVAVSMCMSMVSHLTTGDPNVHLKRVFDEMFHCDIMFSD
jgi:predicted unusual protein kinase regulating ubiquinone biosynthesis (AarF/ABC1/UbiB family)